MSNSNLIGSAVLTIPATVDLPSATDTTLGGVMVQSDSGILVDSNGNLSVDDTQFLSVSTAASTYVSQSSLTLTLANYLTSANAETLYAPLDNPTFTSLVQVPQAPSGTNNDVAASTSFVIEAIESYPFIPAVVTQVVNPTSNNQTITVNDGTTCLYVLIYSQTITTINLVFPSAAEGQELQIVINGMKPGSLVQLSNAGSFPMYPNSEFGTGANNYNWIKYTYSNSVGWFQSGNTIS